jgi:hypothetical protein
MQANPRSLDALFNSQLRYVVPMFQRLYVWKETPQWSTLWEDVTEKADLQLAGKSTNPHYLGALIIEGVRPNSPREVKRFLIIDGQQRLTTLQLLFCAYRDLARKNDWKTLDRSTTRYIENADADVMEHPDEEIYKLWPTTLNREIFGQVISAGSNAAVEARFPLVRLPRKHKPEPRSTLVEAYLYFYKSITDWIAKSSARIGKSEEDCAFTLLQAVQQDFCVVEIALSEGDDSQEIFYSLNSQGRPLSQSDLLRSLIFMRAEKEKVGRDAIFNEYWGKFETSFWSTEVKRGGHSYSRLDLGLRFFLMAKTGELVNARRVNEEYKSWVTSEPPRYSSVRQELADFDRYAEAYHHFEAAVPSNLSCTDLRRVIADFDVSTALPLILYLQLDAGSTTQQVNECLSLVESFIARRTFTREETKEYNKLFVEVIGSLRGLSGDQVKPALGEKLLSGGGTTRRWPTDEEMVDKAISAPAYQNLTTPALRLILERMEVAERTKKSETLEVPTGLQIEHVLPESWGAHWALKGKSVPAQVVTFPHLAMGELAELADLIRARNSRLQTVGNLTLLNKYLNPAASNGSFDLKLLEYKHSLLRLNRYFDGRSAWDEEAINNRSKLLGQLLCEIWPRPVGAGF